MRKHTVSLVLVAILVLAVSGCAPTPAPPTKAILEGRVVVPQGAVRQVGGQALAGATVRVKDLEGNIVATTTTDANGYYRVEVPAGGPYIIEAVKGSIKVLDVSPQVEAGKTYDLGTADATSTAVALVFQARVEAGEDPAEIDLEELAEDPKIGNLIEAVEEALAAGKDPTTAPEVIRLVNIIVSPPAPAPKPTPTPTPPAPPPEPEPEPEPEPTPTPTPVTAVNISGDTVIGETLTATVTPSGATVTYQWQSATEEDGTYTDIADATKNKYELTEGDKDKWIKVKVTGIGIYTGTVTSNPVGPVARVFNATQKEGYDTVSLAIDGAISGDTIVVGAGTYSTTGGEIFPITIDKANLTIKGAQFGVNPTKGTRAAESQESVIDATGASDKAVYITASGVTFDGFTVKNATGALAAIIVGDPNSTHTAITTEDLTVSNNILTTSKRGLAIYDNRNSLIKDNHIVNNNDIAIYIAATESSTVIDSNLIFENIASGAYGAITITNGDAYPDTCPTISNNDIIDNGLMGIKIHRASAIIQGNTITDHIWNGIYAYDQVDHAPATIIEDNTIMRNGNEVPALQGQPVAGVEIIIAHTGPVDNGIIIKGNIISDNPTWGISISNSVDYPKVEIENNTISRNTWDGIYFYNNCESDSVFITDNTITYNGNDGILIDEPHQTGWTCRPTIHSNKISGNVKYGVENKDTRVTINAECNWWGHPDGPSRDSVAAGDKVSANVDYDPWCTNESCSNCNQLIKAILMKITFYQINLLSGVEKL